MIFVETLIVLWNFDKFSVIRSKFVWGWQRMKKFGVFRINLIKNGQNSLKV